MSTPLSPAMNWCCMYNATRLKICSNLYCRHLLVFSNYYYWTQREVKTWSITCLSHFYFDYNTLYCIVSPDGPVHDMMAKTKSQIIQSTTTKSYQRLSQNQKYRFLYDHINVYLYTLYCSSHKKTSR